jgi:hypothetical protein
MTVGSGGRASACSGRTVPSVLEPSRMVASERYRPHYRSLLRPTDGSDVASPD